MLCQRCKKNEATISYKETINGKSVEYHLCRFCYDEMFGELYSTNADIFTGLFAPKPKRIERCPVCGTSYSEYQSTGLLGCAACYDAFKTELMPVIQRIQGHTEHVGKATSNDESLDLHRKLNQLQDELEKAVKNKEFMKANDINEQIIALTKQLNGGNGEQH